MSSMISNIHSDPATFMMLASMAYSGAAPDRFVDGAGGSIRHALVRVDPRGRAGDLLADQPELGNGPSELLSLRRVLDARAQRPLHAAHGEGGQLQPADVEDVEGDLVPLADLPEDVFHRHLRVLEDQGRGRAAA